jgi:glycosidase
VREFLFGIAEHWIRFGIDGWRLDVPAEINDDAFWQEFTHRVKTINPDAYIVGEIWHEAQRWLSGDQFDAVMNYLVAAAVLSFFGNDRLNMTIVNQAGGLNGRVHPEMDAAWFANEIERLTNLYNPEITRSQLNLLDSHDMPRFLTCVSNDVPSLELAMLFMFTYPGAPCLYYGDEIGMTGAHDPDCRRGFPWDEARWNHELLNYTKTLITLRKDYPALRSGLYHRLYSEGQFYAFARSLEDQSFVVALNASNNHQKVAIPAESLSMQGNTLTPLFGPVSQLELKNNQLHLELLPRTGTVIRLT